MYIYIYLYLVERDYTAMVFVAQNYPNEVRSGRIFVSYAQVLGRVDVRSRPTWLRDWQPATLYPIIFTEKKLKGKRAPVKTEPRFHSDCFNYSIYRYCINSTSPTCLPLSLVSHIHLFLAHEWVDIYQRLVFFTGLEIRNQPRVMFN